MGQRTQGQRLRRDLRGFAAGSEGESVLLVFAVFPLLLGAGAANLIWSAIFFVLLLLAYAPCEVVLGDAELDAGHRFGRSPFGRLQIKRSDVAQAHTGMIYHFRGAQVPGVRLELTDGSDVGLPLSGLLGEQRREDWISDINAWVSAS